MAILGKGADPTARPTRDGPLNNPSTGASGTTMSHANRSFPHASGSAHRNRRAPLHPGLMRSIRLP